MNKQIVKRMEELLSNPNAASGEKKESTNVRPKTSTTHTRQKHLREVQAELIANSSPAGNNSAAPTLDNDVVTPIKDLIDARIAQTEGPEEHNVPAEQQA